MGLTSWPTGLSLWCEHRLRGLAWANLIANVGIDKGAVGHLEVDGHTRARRQVSDRRRQCRSGAGALHHRQCGDIGGVDEVVGQRQRGGVDVLQEKDGLPSVGVARQAIGVPSTVLSSTFGRTVQVPQRRSLPNQLTTTDTDWQPGNSSTRLCSLQC